MIRHVNLQQRDMALRSKAACADHCGNEDDCAQFHCVFVAIMIKGSGAFDAHQNAHLISGAYVERSGALKTPSPEMRIVK